MNAGTHTTGTGQPGFPTSGNVSALVKPAMASDRVNGAGIAEPTKERSASTTARGTLSRRGQIRRLARIHLRLTKRLLGSSTKSHSRSGAGTGSLDGGAEAHDGV